MHDEEAETILYREMLESDGAVETLRRDALPPMLIGDDWRGILLFQRDFDGLVIRLRVAHNAMTRDGECCQEIRREEEGEKAGE